MQRQHNSLYPVAEAYQRELLAAAGTVRPVPPRGLDCGYVLDTVQDYRFLAGHKLARDDAYAQWRGEAELARLLADDGPPAPRRRVVTVLRLRLGAWLVRVGECLLAAVPAPAQEPQH